jgi:phosphate transport system substrate-binding protein
MTPLKSLKEKKTIMQSIRRATLGGLVLGLALSACGGSAAPPATVEVTRVVNGTPQTVVITATPEASLPEGSVQINGAGATFPLPVYTEWTYAYQYVDPSVSINYQGIGSGGGKKAIIDGTVDFAGSDSLLTQDEYTAGGDLQMYPAVAGAEVMIFNIDGITADDPPLVFSRDILVGIYDGSIKTWDDPAITALNPDLASKLPGASITAVHRSDGSGTTEIFTRTLSSISQDWADNVGFGPSVEWPVDKAGNGIGGKGNQGVAAAVQNTPNSVGYVELSYAVSNKITFAQLQNKAGNTLSATADTLQSAMADFAGSFSPELTAVIVDAPGDNSWPIAGYTYLVLHTQWSGDCVKAQKLLEYVDWTLTDDGAAQRASDLGYAVLPDAVRAQVLAKLGEVTCDGNPVMAMGN